MMDRKENIPIDDRHIEDLLRPRCEFHASPELYARIISAAKRQPDRKPWYKKWTAIAASAAAVAAVIIAATIATLHHAGSHSRQVLAMATDSTAPDQPIIEKPVTPDIIEKESRQADDFHKEDRVKKIYRKSAGRRKNQKGNNVITSKNLTATEPTALHYADARDGENHEFDRLPAGPMPTRAETETKATEKTTLTTDECDEYISIIRAAYINNIERMREEVAETKTFIKEMRVSGMQNLK